MLVKEFIEDFYNQIGDTECTTEETLIIAWINRALRTVAKEDGLERLLERHEVFNLAGLNEDGTRATSWDINPDPEYSLSDDKTNACGVVVEDGKCTLKEHQPIIDIASMRMLKLDNDGCMVKTACLCYMQPSEFYMCNPLPQQNKPGTPASYTMEQIGTDISIVFNRPPEGVYAIDMVYSSYHKKITSVDDEIDIPYAYLDTLLEFVIILYKMSSDDNSTAVAYLEQYDMLVEKTVQRLAKRKSTLGYRRIQRGF